MSDFIKMLKAFFRNLSDKYSTPKEINTIRDYRYVKQWVKKTCTRYIIFTILAMFEITLVGILLSIAGMPKGLMYIAIPILAILLLLTNWGYATLIMYLPEISKSVFKAGKAGYEIGEKFETTHVDVTHEFGNSYRVSATTENKGCLVGFVVGMIRFMTWLAFCVYIGPFLTFIKIKKSVENLKQYELQKNEF